MKKFSDYLLESKKTYSFRVKIAGDLPENFETDLKASLERFSLVSLGKGKRTPIQDVPLDFPELKNKEVTIYAAEVNYPTTPQVLTDYICDTCKCDRSMLRVRSTNEPTEEYQQHMTDNSSSDKVEERGQELVGAVRVSNFLKELAAEAKDRENKNLPKEPASTMPEPEAAVSPIGSNARKGK